MAWSMVGQVARSWSLAISTCKDLGCTLHTLCRISFKNMLGNYSKYKNAFWFYHHIWCEFLHFHNMVVRCNTFVDYIPKMAIVSAKNINVWYIILAIPNKPIGALGLGIKLGTFLSTYWKPMPPEDSEWYLSTWMITRAAFGIKPHHIEDPTFHQHLMVFESKH